MKAYDDYKAYFYWSVTYSKEITIKQLSNSFFYQGESKEKGLG